MPERALPELSLADLRDLAGRTRRGFRRLLRRLVAPRPRSEGPDPGPPAVADGDHAVAVTEAWIGDAAALSPQARERAAGRAFASEAARGVSNLFGRPVAWVPAASPRGALATAVGLTEAGRRTALFLGGSELELGRDLLARAVERRLPLVVHLDCDGESEAADGHGAIHLVAATGALTLVAANVQEAVDLTVVARRVAEEALLPAVVALDAETATSVQEVHLPAAEAVRRFLGSPADTVHAPTPAQELLFGRHRRRLPRSQDPERPLLAGAPRGAEAAERSTAARRIYLDAGVEELLERAGQQWTELTGRPVPLLSVHGMDKAERFLVAMGAAVEPAEAAAERLREERHRVGVLGVRCLTPFPAETVGEVVRRAGAASGWVLERTPGDGRSGPLTEAIYRSTHWNKTERPVLHPVIYGLGGRSVAGAELVALAREARDRREGDDELAGEGRPAPRWLGIDFAPDLASEPKRQAMRDALRRDYPRAAAHSAAWQSRPVDLRSAGTVSVAVPRQADDSLIDELAAVLHRALGGHLRSRRAGTRGGTEPPVERLVWSAEPLRDPGAATPVELRLTSLAELRRGAPWHELSEGGALLVPLSPGTRIESLEELAPVALRQARVEGVVQVFTVALPAGSESATSLATSIEIRLGALLGVLESTGRLAPARVSGLHRKLLDARRDLLREEGAEEGRRKDLLDAFTAGLDGAQPFELTRPAKAPAGAKDIAAPETEPLTADRLPASVRRLARPDGGGLDDLPRFWDQVGSLYRRGEADRLLPDPHLGLGVLPPRTAAFRSFAADRDMLPAFDPAACTGCGACWSSCPHGALEPAVLGMGALVDAGMARASAAGATVDVLRGVRSRLVSALGRELGKIDGGPVGPMLDRAFETATAKMPLSDERKEALVTAFQAVREQLAELPLARTAPFFDGPEKDSNDSGEALTLAVDPDACRACGLCVAVCEPEALTAETDAPRRSAEARDLLRRIEELPAPSAETVERAREHPDVGPVAGALLDRQARQVMGGGEGAEPGSGAALALHRVLGLAAWHLAPRRRERLRRIEELRGRLAAAIHDELAGALPEQDLDALARGLESVTRPDADLGEITERIESAFDNERVDVVRLRRLVQVAREVADLAYRIEHGGGGLGRAPFELVLGPGAERLATFPWNPFAVPVTVDSSAEAAERARGLAAGRLQEALEETRLLRRAERELEARVTAPDADLPLGLADLTDEERGTAPPVWLVAEERELTSGGLAGLLDLLGSDLPVRLLLVSSEDPRRSDGLDAGLLALVEQYRASRETGAGCTLAQSSLAVPVHLDRAVRAATESAGSALLRLPTPSPSRQSFAPDDTLERAHEAFSSGLVPLYLSRSVTAETDGQIPALDLGGNPDLGERASELPAGVRATWSLLHRLAAAEPASGETRPQPEPRAEEEDLSEVEERHRQELAALEAEHQAQLASLRAQVRAETRLETAHRVRARLLELAMRGAGKAPGPDAGRDAREDAEEGVGRVVGTENGAAGEPPGRTP